MQDKLVLINESSILVIFVGQIEKKKDPFNCLLVQWRDDPLGESLQSMYIYFFANSQ